MTFKSTYVKPVYPHAHLPVLTEAMVPKTVLMQALFRALRSRRAGDSMAEARFVSWLVQRVPVSMIDAAGNIHVDLRRTPEHRTMFTSHTDTVHHIGGTNEIRLDASNPNKVLWRAGEGACLGADDGAGVALMLHMIAAKVPGLYVFFRGEEAGGIGSSWLAKSMPQALKDIDRCISLDRADYSDVITHQGGQRCCSEAFAEALADQLTTDDLSLAYVPDATGVFTDSANLTELVPECTNLSVGYKSQHGDAEWQDVTFLPKLAAALVSVQWDSLPVKRNPAEEEVDMLSTFGGWGGHISTTDAFDEYLIDALRDAIDQRVYTDLLNIVAEHALPDDMETARKFISFKNVSARMLETYADGIASGEYTADAVLDVLVEDCIQN